MKEGLTSDAELDNFQTEIRPLWVPIFKNKNSKTLLCIYVSILYRNKKHKVKTERGVDVTRKSDEQMDREMPAITISPTFFKNAGIITSTCIQDGCHKLTKFFFYIGPY